MAPWGKLAIMLAMAGLAQSQEWKFDPLTGKKIKKGPKAPSIEKQRLDATWGRVYLEGAVDGKQYLKGNFGEKDIPAGLHDLVLADPITACDMAALEEGETSPYAGKFVFAQRGDCTFEAKAVALNSHGASALIVGNNDGGIINMPGSQALEIDIASVMVNNFTSVYLETLVREGRGASADGSVSMALLPISCGTREELFKLNLVYKLDGETDHLYECLTPLEKDRKLMELTEGGVLVVGDAEIEYLTSTFGGPSLGKKYPFFISDTACDAIPEEAAGKIVVVQRGECELLQKAENVQTVGGIAMVVVNDGPGMSRMSTASQWESAHVVVHSTMVTKKAGEILVAAIEANSDAVGEFQGGRVTQADWQEVVRLMDIENWPTSKRKGKALYQTMKEKYAGSSDKLECLSVGFEAFKEDHGIKEEL